MSTHGPDTGETGSAHMHSLTATSHHTFISYFRVNITQFSYIRGTRREDDPTWVIHHPILKRGIFAITLPFSRDANRCCTPSFFSKFHLEITTRQTHLIAHCKVSLPPVVRIRVRRCRDQWKQLEAWLCPNTPTKKNKYCSVHAFMWCQKGLTW